MRAAEIYVAIISLAVSTAIIYYVYPVVQSRCKHTTIVLQKNLKLVYSQIEILRRNHSRLLLSLKKHSGFFNISAFNISLSGLHLELKPPSKEYEVLRRRIYSNTKELYYCAIHQLWKWYYEGQLWRTDNYSLSKGHRQVVLEEVADRKRSLLSDQEMLPKLDGQDKWRRREAASVSDLIQRRLHYLQNPANCSSTKKILCRHSYAGGIGCHLHYLSFCLLVSYSEERTLVLLRGNNTLWDNMFNPLSKSCTTYPTKVSPVWVRFNGDPFSWWLGQLVKFNLNLRRQEVINDALAMINFSTPIVGVHIRGTDKLLTEAQFYGIEEYISHVDDYYAKLELTRCVVEKRVYLATDNVNTLKEAIAKYPQYTFYGDAQRAETATETARWTSEGVTGILVDLYALSMCDYIVCTFSSNIGRMAYELMQTKRIDAVTRVTSIDDAFYFTGNEKHINVAVMRHKDISLEIGDKIEYDRYNNGTVVRTSLTGRIPWYKTEEQLLQYPYPEYKEVPIFTDNLPDLYP